MHYEDLVTRRHIVSRRHSVSSWRTDSYFSGVVCAAPAGLFLRFSEPPPSVPANTGSQRGVRDAVIRKGFGDLSHPEPSRLDHTC